MFLKFSDSCQKLLYLSLKEKNKFNDDYIGSEHIFLAVLKNKNHYVCKLLNDNNINYENFSLNIKKKDKKLNNYSFIYTPLMKDIFLKLSKSKNDYIDISDIVLEILNIPNSKVNLILKNMSIDVSKFLKNMNISCKKKNKNHKSLISDIGICLNEKCLNDGEKLLGREKELFEIIEILCCKNKNNPLLVGDAGVGKSAIIEELARMIELNKVPGKIRNKKIYSISMSSLVAGTKYRGEFEDKINRLINEVENDDDIILFIDEIHTLVGAGGADGAIDASNILKPSLARGNIKIIGATTRDEYNKFFLTDKALNRRFRLVNIDEPSFDETKDILNGIKSIYENYHGVVIPDNIINLIMDFSNRYFCNKKFPDKAIDLLDEICVLSTFSLKPYCNDIDKVENDIRIMINHKNKALISGDYKSAINYSLEEKELFSKLSFLQEKVFNDNSKIFVSDKDLYKVVERKTNIPFYSYKYDFNSIKSKIKKYKNNSLFTNEIISKSISIFNNFYNNLINNIGDNKMYIYSDNYNKNLYFIDEYLDFLFKKINRIYIDCNDINSLDSLYKTNIIKNVQDNSFSVVVFNNFDNNIIVKEFIDDILKKGYYINSNNEKVPFNNIIFIYNMKNINNRIGFFKENNIYDCFLDVSNVSKNKIKNKINNFFSKKNILLSKNELNILSNNLCNNCNDFNNIDFYINKEYKILKNNKKNRLIKV